MILYYLNINIPEDASFIVDYSFNIFIIALISLLCFFNVVGYLISIILINKYDIETKFPKLKKIIKYYNKNTIFWIIIEGVMCTIFLLSIILISLSVLGLTLNK